MGKRPTDRRPPAKPSRRATAPRSNRIYELTQARNWTYADVAARASAIAQTRGDAKRSKIHTLTIQRLAQPEGTPRAMQLNQGWMELLAEVFGVTPPELISRLPGENLRRVEVRIELEGGQWQSSHELNQEKKFEIMIRDEPDLRDLMLYGVQIKGPHMNRVFPDQSIAIASRITQRPGEIDVGFYYHVRITRKADGLSEETLKLLAIDGDGKFWLRPESDHPLHQEWIPLDGDEAREVQLLGRVQAIYQRLQRKVL